jgi:hypothetical protein
MYKIDVDKDKKIINIELSGRMLQKELETYTMDIIQTISQFKRNEVLVLASMERLDPVSQENISICIENLSALSAYIKKVAFVHKRFVARLQQERIVQTVNALKGIKLKAKSFNSRKDALKFLYE